MRKLRLILLLIAFVIINSNLSAQIVWTEKTSEHNLPEGVRVFTGVQISPPFLLHYLEVDMNNPDIIVHPFFSPSFRTTTNFSTHVGAIAAINAGFFSTTASVSSLIEAGEVNSQNIKAINRDGIVYPVSRAFFGIKEDRTMRMDWVYHFSNELDDFYRYDAPPANVIGAPAPIPTMAGGIRYNDVLMGVGGGPNLVTNGQVNVTYNEEVFFGGSGVDGDQNRARTAVGFTSDHKVIMLIADSGTMVSSGIFASGSNLNRLAELMIELGCVEAINLDGGGSSTMAIASTLYNRPNGGTTQRPVPTIIAVVPIDSLRLPVAAPQGIILDTEMDEVVTFTGEKTSGLSNTAWFQTANPGYFGPSPSWLREKGNGSDYVTYAPELKQSEYEVYGWWTASFNRTSDTPYIVHHQNGIDTVRMNQQINDAQWVYVGKWQFSGTSSDKVVISNHAANGTYVVADAIRFTEIIPTNVKEYHQPQSLQLKQNYPNPFNPSTRIPFSLINTSRVELKVFDIRGRLIAVIFDGVLTEGEHSIQFNAPNLGSGIYVYELSAGGAKIHKLMSLIK